MEGLVFCPQRRTTIHVQSTSSGPGVLLMACGPVSGTRWVRRVFDLGFNLGLGLNS